MNLCRRHRQKQRRRAEKRDARIVLAHQQYILDVLNSRPSPGSDSAIIALLPPNTDELVPKLGITAKVAKVAQEVTPLHRYAVGLRFEPDGGDRWRVTIVKNRGGYAGISLRVGLSTAGRWVRA